MAQFRAAKLDEASHAGPEPRRIPLPTAAHARTRRAGGGRRQHLARAGARAGAGAPGGRRQARSAAPGAGARPLGLDGRRAAGRSQTLRASHRRAAGCRRPRGDRRLRQRGGGDGGSDAGIGKGCVAGGHRRHRRGGLDQPARRVARGRGRAGGQARGRGHPPRGAAVGWRRQRRRDRARGHQRAVPRPGARRSVDVDLRARRPLQRGPDAGDGSRRARQRVLRRHGGGPGGALRRGVRAADQPVRARARAEGQRAGRRGRAAAQRLRRRRRGVARVEAAGPRVRGRGMGGGRVRLAAGDCRGAGRIRRRRCGDGRGRWRRRRPDRAGDACRSPFRSKPPAATARRCS